ncbi:unnamed protein product [Plutella xylostella]|uniref:(diamondback moth) hypothetical protein n=1 Tax=Plutella xylostella TaxID=51655 RepID=A0A8S4EY86_PLUXY|nr:unnamed protein product [Plutella xylostella]
MSKRKLDEEPIRCEWLTNDAFYIKYHDEEWGRPIRDSQKLFEMICLEGQQAGLSWRTILDKRENYRKAFHNFDPHRISQMTDKEVEKLSQNNNIVRHKAKVNSIINNAKAYVSLEKEGHDFGEFIWSFVEGESIVNNWKSNSEIPTETSISVDMAKSLKRKKFTFVGPKICYAFMQACGLVNDHLVNCIARNT